jgi:hypothetical protein
MRLTTVRLSTLGLSSLGLSTLGLSSLGLSTLGLSSLGLSTLGLSSLGLSTLGLSTLVCLFASCASAGGAPPDLSDTRFERSLEIDLASMTKTPSGLYYKDLKEGQYELVKTRQRVTVRYTGWIPNGTKVDSSEGIEFRLGSGQVIQGWDIGVEGMRVGGVRTLVIPPELGYRYREVGKIPAGSVLVFRVELIKVRD